MRRFTCIITSLLIAVATNGCAGGTAHLPGSAQSSAIARDASDGASGSGHLYVSGFVSNAIYEYALTNGLPSASPDRTLSTNLFNIVGVATGPDGDLYVAGSKALKNEVAWTSVYAPAASGNDKPVRNLRDGADGIAVDPNGYLYEYGRVYAPNAFGHEKPVQNLKVPKGSLFDSVAIDSKGDAYVDDASKVYVFNDPVGHPRHIRTICWKGAPKSSNAIAVGSDGTEYVGINDYGSSPGQILVFAPGANDCTPVRTITTTDEPLSIIGGLVSNGSYLYALDYGGSLVVLDPAQGAQTPIARVATASPAYGLALGP